VVWALGSLIFVLVLMIPILAIVLDSQLGQALANRIARGTGPADAQGLLERVQALEAEVRFLTESMESVREDTEFVRSLIEGPEADARPGLGPGKSPRREG
jgi:hypothetical protein